MEKTFLSIGTGPGIGLSTAILFAREGYRPVLACRTATNLAKLAENVRRATGVDAETLVLDAGDMTQMAALRHRLAERVHVLHYNAAIVHAESLAAATLTSLELDIRVGITGALAAIKTFAPVMLERKYGSILLTGGMLAYTPNSQYLALGVAKAGISNMAHALFGEFSAKNVHIACVNVTRAVAPGSPEAEEVARAFWRMHSQPYAQWTCEENDA